MKMDERMKTSIFIQPIYYSRMNESNERMNEV